ncbi:hypothetical protein [Thermodesulfitimonas sp.]
MPRERDYTLDLLKTLGCLLMVFAHSHVVTNDWFTHYVVFLGTFAPVLFFGVCGVTASFQLRSRPWPVLAISYALFFLIGLSFIGTKGIDFWREPQCEIFQGIALGVIATALLVRLLGEESGLLFPLPFLLYVLCKKAVVAIPVVAGFLFPPGLFPLFSWLSFFLWGLFCYRFRRAGFLLALAAAGAYFLLVVTGKGHCEKWAMNAGYFLRGLTLYGLLFNLCSLGWRAPEWLIYTGKHSLLFSTRTILYSRSGAQPVFPSCRNHPLSADDGATYRTAVGLLWLRFPFRFKLPHVAQTSALYRRQQTISSREQEL